LKPDPKARDVLEADIAILGGGLGGIAAALASARAGASVVLTEPTAWIGGQMTSQAVSAPDEHGLIETFGGTRSYQDLRAAIRRHYRESCGAPATMWNGAPLNPGNGWVSRLCFEPKVGVAVLENMLEPFLASGRIRLFRGMEAAAVDMDGSFLRSVRLAPTPFAVADTPSFDLRARWFLDATELGDLLAFSGLPSVTGAESRSETGEPHALAGSARPDWTQSFTTCFVLEHRPGEDHVGEPPEGYAELRDAQPFAFTLTGSNGKPNPFKMFAMNGGLLPFWTYRQIFDAALSPRVGRPHSLALINWDGNDCRAGDLVGANTVERTRLIGESKRLSRAFLHWLRTEAPHDEGTGRGFPGLRLATDVLGTADGMAMAPYIRESLRILPLERLREQDMVATSGVTRAKPFHDAVAIGHYPIDIHHCANGGPALSLPTHRFQIPLGAMVPRVECNLIPACKNIGATHISNGATRLHPVEWAIGEAAGTLGAFCLAHGEIPHRMWRDSRPGASGASLRAYQARLLAQGIPLAWTPETPPGHADFASRQSDALARS
jgi:hypothetical protein